MPTRHFKAAAAAAALVAMLAAACSNGSAAQDGTTPATTAATSCPVRLMLTARRCHRIDDTLATVGETTNVSIQEITYIDVVSSERRSVGSQVCAVSTRVHIVSAGLDASATAVSPPADVPPVTGPASASREQMRPVPVEQPK